MAVDYLSDKEKEKVEKFVKDTVAFNAVIKVILEPIYHTGVLDKGADPEQMRNWALIQAQQAIAVGHKPEDLGNRVMATYEGLQMLQKGIDELKKINTQPEPVKTDKQNDAL